MCWTDKHDVDHDCGKCNCPRSAEYDKHNKVATGETVTIGPTTVPTFKCTKGCGQYQY
jgi:hypothetical protein